MKILFLTLDHYPQFVAYRLLIVLLVCEEPSSPTQSCKYSVKTFISFKESAK